MNNSCSMRSLQRIGALMLGIQVLLGCSRGQATVVVDYATYVPDQGSLFALTFEYPASWIVYAGEDSEDLASLTIVDPALPTTQPGFEPNPEEPGILIDVERIEPATFRLADEMDRFRQATESIVAVTIIRERELTIAGYPAWWVTRHIDPRPIIGQRAPLLNETVFWLANDRFYTFTLSVREDQRDGLHGEAFDHLIATIEVVP